MVALLGGFGFILLSRRRAAPAGPAPLTEEERRRLAALDKDANAA